MTAERDTGQRPITRADIDAVVPDRPVVVYSGMHVSTLNTAGMRASGLLDGAVLPRGVLFDPESGRGTELWSWLPAPGFGTARIADAMARLGGDMFTARGVTSINDVVHSTGRGHGGPAGSPPAGLSQPDQERPGSGVLRYYLAFSAIKA